MIPINLSVYCGLKLMKFQIEVLVKEYIQKYVWGGAGIITYVHTDKKNSSPVRNVNRKYSCLIHN